MTNARETEILIKVGNNFWRLLAAICLELVGLVFYVLAYADPAYAGAHSYLAGLCMGAGIMRAFTMEM